MICIRQVEFNPCAAMTIDDLKNVRLGEASRRYLGIYLKICDLYAEIEEATSLVCYPDDTDRINEPFTDALDKAQSAVRDLFTQSVTEHLHDLKNHTEL